MSGGCETMLFMQQRLRRGVFYSYVTIQLTKKAMVLLHIVRIIFGGV